VNGYEIQVTELLQEGVFESCNMQQLAAMFVAIVHEPRRGQDGGLRRSQFPTGVVRKAENAVNRFMAIELAHGFDQPIKAIDFGLSEAIVAWAEGCEIEHLGRLAGSDPGDAVRTLRLAIQMMRQLRSALSGGYPLIDRLEEAIVGVNRDEVDAKRQFQLG
jgi:superfamily II RNA helicase